MKKHNVFVSLDLQNCNNVVKHLPNLLQFLSNKGSIIDKKVYYNGNYDNQNKSIEMLKLTGFDCINVTDKTENSADYRLSSDLFDIWYKKQVNEIILISGDGDFISKVIALQKLGVKVTIIAQKNKVSTQLKDIADEFRYLDELPQLIEIKPISSTVSNSHISYEEAVKMLIETINKALQQKQKTTLSLIGKLMRKIHNLPQFPSVNKDGKTISKLSKLVDNAINDGLLIMNNDCLILANA